jgi:UDP-GlcNAc:undecaprenyl-phosphate GlcNAc-1-phosphate transferase
LQALFAFIVAFALALGLTPLVRALARKSGFMAYPDERSVHQRPVPYLGGVAIYLASVAAVLVTGPQDRPTQQALIFGGLFILIVGIIDDLYNLKPWQKVLGQLGSALIVVALGVDISFLTDPFTGKIRFTGIFAIPLTILWVISFENLVNLSDGLDGLAAGISGITALVTVFASVRAGVPSVGLAAAAIAGSVFGFLPYNWHPASIFMGDAGAMYLGLALSVISVQGLVKSTLAMAVLAPILALFVPISDAAFAILRRRSLGRPVARRDNDHIHHRLLELGLGQKRAVLTIYVVTAVFGVLGLFSTFLPISGTGPLAGLAVLGVLLVAHKMGILALPAERCRRKSRTNEAEHAE